MAEPVSAEAIPDDSIRALSDELQKERNRAASYKDLWDQSCRAVDQLCREAGAPDGSMHDVWTLRECIQKLKDRRERAKDPKDG